MKYKIVALALICTFCFVSLLGGLVSAQEIAATVKGQANEPSFQLYPKRVELSPGGGYNIKMTTSTPVGDTVNRLTVSIIYPPGWYWDTSTLTGTYVIEGDISDNPIILSLDNPPLIPGSSVTDWITFTCPSDTPSGDYKITAVDNIGYTETGIGPLEKFGRQDVTVTITSQDAMQDAKQAQAKIIEAQNEISMVEGLLAQAKSEGKDVSFAEVTLNQAKSNLQLAQSVVNSNPTAALASANNALAQAQNAKAMILQAEKEGLSIPVMAGAAVVAIAVAGVVVVIVRRRKK